MKRLILWVLSVPVLCFSVTYYYDISRTVLKGRESLTVTQDGACTVLSWKLTNGRESLSVRLTNGTEVLEAVMKDDPKSIFSLAVDYGRRRVTWTGAKKGEISLPGGTTMFDNTAFYIIPKIAPLSNKTIRFTMIQVNEMRTVDMYLRHLRREKMPVGNRILDADVYEYGIANSLIAAFWPHKYHYWISAENRRMLKYEGPESNLSNEVIVLVE
jgi:hypothetical protein